MPSFEILITFFIATMLFAYMPGPAMLYATAQTIARGRRAGWLAALGIHLGGYVHVIAAALGLALLFKAIPVFYFILKFAGAAYLIFLGIKMFRTKKSASAVDMKTVQKTPKQAFWESVTVEVLNPKTALFFVAFLPQFSDPSAAFPIWIQLLVLGTIVNIMFSSADITCVLLADKMTAFLKKSLAAGRLAQKIGGSILVVLGLNIALSRQ
ncbi:LysE family translocator [Amylibacter sp. SFDW26]|uniref:LysE family translocator n=1 Tax=Amylibacter sp. SFDW26 TaxID=2652722 RepID=UPI0012626AC1|nr:LysE family translocator [Amylibacter sp. SFDW26]KAB7615315.1 LysE family translocator [Amylibacter sp. SFDW26]